MAKTRNYMVLTALMVGSFLHAENPLLTCQQAYDAMENPIGYIAINKAVGTTAEETTGKKYLIKKEILGVPVLSTKEATTATLYAAKTAVDTGGDPKETAIEVTATMGALKGVAYAKKFAQSCGITLPELLKKEYPGLTQTVEEWTEGVVVFALRAYLQGTIRSGIARFSSSES